jgi:pyruvate-formate lyase
MPQIILKQNATAGLMPVASELEIGEPALNTADGKLYSKMADGTVRPIAGSASPSKLEAARMSYVASLIFGG